MKYNTLGKICAIIVFLDIAYMLYAEGSYFTWTVFFVLTVLAILFNALDEKDKKIEILRMPKDNDKQQPKN